MKLDIRDSVRRASILTAQLVLRAAGAGDFFLLPKSSKASQVLLSMQYKQMLALHLPLPKFEDVEFRTFSQEGEDGILLYIFSLIGTTNKRCVEFGGGAGYDNTANLIVNHGWEGLFFDGDENNVKNGQGFYAKCGDTKMWPPKLVHAWITPENINTLLQENDYMGEIDLLSLDIDGVDYWVWKAIESINPRVVVLEYNNVLGPDASVTVPNKTNFQVEPDRVSVFGHQTNRVVNPFLEKTIPDRLPTYYGASLQAFVKLGKQKGYRLVGCARYGRNAFFVRSDIGEEILPEIAPAECFNHSFTKYMMERKEEIADKEWVEV